MLCFLKVVKGLLILVLSVEIAFNTFVKKGSLLLAKLLLHLAVSEVKVTIESLVYVAKLERAKCSSMGV